MRRKTTDSAKPRATPDRVLFRVQYVRMLLPLMVTIGGIYVVLRIVGAIVARAQQLDQKELGQFLDAVFLSILFVLPLPVGAMTFSRPFKEQHIVFFHSLPIARWRQWLIIVTASFLALVTIVAAFFIARPSMARLFASQETTPLWVAVALMTYAAGLCFALAIRVTPIVYVAAYTAALGLMFLGLIAAMAPQTAFEQPFFRPEAQAARFIQDVLDGRASAAIVVVTALVLTALFLAASLRFFVRGEVTLLRMQIRNYALVLGAGIVVALVAGPVGLAWAGSSEVRGWNLRVSPRGSYLTDSLRDPERPWRRSYLVADLRGSGAASRVPVPGLLDQLWRSDSELLLLVRDISPWRRLGYLRGSNDWLERRSVDGKVLGRVHVGGTIVDFTRRDGPLLLIIRRGSEGFILACDQNLRLRELARAPLHFDARFTPSLALFYNLVEPSRVFRIDERGARELPWVRHAGREVPLVIEDRVYPNEDVAIELLEKERPVPRQAGEHVAYYLGAGWAADVRHLYARVDGAAGSSLYLWRPGTRQWQLVDQQLHVPQRPIEPVTVAIGGETVSINRESGHAVYVVRANGKDTVRLFDAERNATLTVGEYPVKERSFIGASLRTIRQPTLQRFVLVSEVVRRHSPRTVASMLYENGTLRPFRLHDDESSLVARLPDNTQINHWIDDIWVYAPDGKRREMFTSW